jgi:prolyl oligopeptidase
VDTYHGVRVPDPYRWLEEMEAEDTRLWVEAQDRRAREFAAEAASRAALRDRVAELADVRRYRPPWKRGGRYFYLTFRSSGGPGTTGTQLHVREDLEGGESAERTLLSQDDLPEGTVLTRIVPGPHGRRVAYGVARDGSRWETLRVFDVERGRALEDRLEGVNTGASTVTWSPNGSGFYYERFDPPAGGNARTARLDEERVLYHTVGTDQEEDRAVFAATAADHGLTVGVGENGRWLVVVERDPETGGDRVRVAGRRADELAFRTLVDDAAATYRFVGGESDRLWFETDRDAPNRKVVAVDLSPVDRTGATETARRGQGSRATDSEGGVRSAAPGGELTTAWREVIPEAAEAINTWLGARMVGRHLVVGYLVDARTEWRVFGLEGRPLRTLELPRLGPVWSGFQPSAGPDETETVYSLSGLADPGSIYRLDLETGRSTLFARPGLGHDPDEFVTRQVFYEGRDGTRIPMYLVHGRDLERDGRAPVIMYGYGFGGWSAEPWFQPHLAAWLRMGGTWALPNIRGGGEYGEAWHRAGSGRDKQTAIDDYLAAAEWLIEEGLTSPGRLVLNASSAGGAVGGGALVQRPELFGAAILDYPDLDLLRHDQFTGGARWRSEFGTAGDPGDFAALLGYSPYHTIRLHRCYPPTLVTPGELDEVTPPLHAYKFTAALQRAQGCEEPILLRVTRGAGHSSGATVEDAVGTWTDQLSFMVRVLGERSWQPASAW